MDLSDVSKTAILTLTCRVIGSERKSRLIKDPKAIEMLDAMWASSSLKERRWLSRIKKKFKGLSSKSVSVVCNRVLAFDKITNEYIQSKPSCTIVNLACGFDTRFWRIQNKECRYIELDFPEVIDLKSNLLKEQISYELIRKSVLESTWIDEVTKNGSHNFLLIAEGLFMYLPKSEAHKLICDIAEKFTDSVLLFDTAHEKYTKGFWRYFTNWNWRSALELDFNYLFGIKDPLIFETYAPGIKVTHSKKEGVGHLIVAAINEDGYNKQ
jgi:methyltransferase (TIGR00027 family)